MPSFEFTMPMEIRFPDLDAYRHVNNAMIFVYIETAWAKMYRHYFGPLLADDAIYVIVHAECNLLRPINLDDNLFVTITCPKVGNSSMDFFYRMHDGQGGTYAKASNVMVRLNPRGNVPVPVPDELRALLTGQWEQKSASR